MRIVLVSTFPPEECGIATYTSYLAPELKNLNNEVYVVSQTGGSGEKVFPVFDSDDPDLPDRVFSAVIKLTPDIVHIQHEYGLFGRDRGVSVIPLLYKLKMAEIPVTVTLHTVYEDFNPAQKLITDGILRTSSAVIVHHEFQKKALEEKLAAGTEIHVIPHGVRQVEAVPGIREKLGIEARKVILIAGYFRPTKGCDRIVRIFPDIKEKVPEACLLIAGKSRLQEYRQYRDFFLKLIEESPAKDSIICLRGQFPQKTFDSIISAADVVPMPYLLGAQSGIMAHSFAFEKPVVASYLPAFRETIASSGGGLLADSDEEFSEAITSLLEDEKLYRSKQKNIREYVEKHLNWGRVAGDTLGVYRKIVNVPYGTSKYIEL